MSDSTPQRLSRTPPPRGQARAALMQAALELVARESNFSALSLRRIARHAGVVPTAFYRHFRDMDDLGITLVEETFVELRGLLSAANIPSLPIEGLIRYSVELFAFHVRDRRLLFQFLVRERYAGSPPIRGAIQTHLDALITQLAADLGKLDGYRAIAPDDLSMVAELVVNAVIAASERILDIPATADIDATVIQRAEKQLRLIFLGLGRWESHPAHDAPPQ